MLGQWSISDRIFVYEVTGLAQTESTTNDQAPIRTSHSQLIQVPFSRMGDTMRKINRLGGQIVDIRPLG
ncbi:MAG: phycobilisome linker polypeptide [Cyanobacteria bacterium]|nr:phycobilisome linker polypeptide [Cyanobacteriota bacterium]MDA0864825.1 phycobilisome linker polypeptide [Cyanobacteriota bacterium]